MDTGISRDLNIREGVRIEIFNIVWMVMEGAVSIGAGLAAGSVLLTAFGVDSLIELASGAILLWRLLVEARGGSRRWVERAEHAAIWVVGIALALLSIYVFLTALYGLFRQQGPESSPVGIAVTLAAIIVMPYLTVTKRRIAARIQSEALKGDAASSLTCAYMAGTVLFGLLLNAFLHWWWAEHIAALVFLFWLVRETREVLEEAGTHRSDNLAGQ